MIPVYNVEQYLERAVYSVLAQTYGNTYTVLVDDGSTDGSGDICDRFARDYENIEVIHKTNGGLSDARNAGIERCLEIGSPDDYITLLDSDDFVREDFAEKMAAVCTEHDCQMAQCGHEKGSADCFPEKRADGVSFIDGSRGALLGYRLKTQMTVKLFRLGLFENERFPVGRLNEDEFIIYRLAYRCSHIAFTEEKLYYYFQRSGSIMDEIAKKLKNSPHRYDWMYAYPERIAFFEEKGEHDQVLRTCEKICTDIILRYTEQLRLAERDRDHAVTDGEYIRTYRYFYKIMMKRRGMPFMRSVMYRAFYVCPYIASIAERFTELRK